MDRVVLWVVVDDWVVNDVCFFVYLVMKVFMFDIVLMVFMGYEFGIDYELVIKVNKVFMIIICVGNVVICISVLLFIWW